jgi:hypothetical protein
VAHDSLSSSSEEEEEDEDSEEDRLDGEEDEHPEFSEEEEEELEDEDPQQSSRRGYHITHPSRSEQKKHAHSALSGGVFHEKNIRASRKNQEILLEAIDVIDAPASAVFGRVTIVDSSEEEDSHSHLHRSKHSKRAKGGKRKNLRAPCGKRVIIHDTSSEEEADL